jgi:hypothetical protein
MSDLAQQLAEIRGEFIVLGFALQLCQRRGQLDAATALGVFSILRRTEAALEAAEARLCRPSPRLMVHSGGLA